MLEELLRLKKKRTTNELNGKFTNEKFSLKHIGNNKFIIINEFNQHYCGDDDGYVGIGSSYWELSDCKEKIFTWEEVKKFVKDRFSCILD